MSLTGFCSSGTCVLLTEIKKHCDLDTSCPLCSMAGLIYITYQFSTWMYIISDDRIIGVYV